MLKKLRIEFIAITLILVGVVLAITLGMSYYSTYTAQYDITMDSLERGLSSESGTGITGHGAPDGDNGHGFMGTFTLTVTASSSGVILGKSDSPISISVDDLATIVTEAVTSSEDSGTNSEYHLAWLKKTTDTGYVISIADTSSRDSALNHQLVMSIGIFAAAMAALFVIVWFLSSWALEPVKDAWERQRRFISDASHELKTPLAVIIANIQILQKDRGIPEQSMHWIDSTADEADHMKSLVEELLVLARTDEATSGTAQSALIREDLDLSELVDESVLEFDAVAFERGCSIDTDIEEGIHLSADKSQIARAVRTLVDNATKYATKGTTVKVTLKRVGKRAKLTVNNASAAIDPEDLDHIFDRFYRSDKARARETGGFGLGLAICKGIVEAHDGEISVTSSDEDGTTFTVLL